MRLFNENPQCGFFCYFVVKVIQSNRESAVCFLCKSYNKLNNTCFYLGLTHILLSVERGLYEIS